MNGVRHVVVDHSMAHQTLLRTRSFGLKLGGRHAQLVNVVTGCAGHSLVGMGREFPTLILLMVALSEILRVYIFNIPIPEPGGFKIHSQCPAGLISYGPSHTLLFGRFPAAVTGTADLGSESRRQMGWIDNGRPFVEYCCFRQRYMVGARAVATSPAVVG